MKKITCHFFSAFFFLTSALFSQQKFYVDLNNIADDLFKVTLYPENLSAENNVFQFAATAPGAYETMDIGRFVKSFSAFDKEGNILATENISTNQWLLHNPEKINKIYYEIAETFDTPVTENPVYEMSGTSIEKDHVLINGQAVFGYIKNMQFEPVEIKLIYPDDWLVGTALSKDENGFYDANSFDQVVDSPILLGTLTKDTIEIENTKIEIYTYSKTGLIKSADVLSTIKDVLIAASNFTNGLPVQHYTFLFFFEDTPAGAWEHSYSSEYIMKELPFSEQYQKHIRDFVAHEFFHVVTPLNIHSELIEHFNFVKPVMSRHLWLYEGVTEWAAHTMQLRSGLMSLDDYFSQFSRKLKFNDRFDQNLSLTELGKNVTDFQDQYYNIYCKGAVIGLLLDIKLLSLSDGKFGLREIINKLSKQYGPSKPFSEDNFFQIFADETFPQVADFFSAYVEGTEKLPLKEYFNKIGIDYYEEKGVDSSNVSLGIPIGMTENKPVVLSSYENDGLQAGDIILKLNGAELSEANLRKLISDIKDLGIGKKYNVTVKRGDEEITVEKETAPAALKHIIEVNKNASDEQIKLREAWLTNLKY